MRWALPLLLLGCYAEVDERACFAEGEAFLDPTTRPPDARRPDPEIPWSAASDVCCDPSSDDGGQAACRAFYRAHESFSEAAGVWQLAACDPAGYCYLACRPGQNCACVVDRDCDTGACRLADRAAEPGVCEAQEQGGDEARCTVCE